MSNQKLHIYQVVSDTMGVQIIESTKNTEAIKEALRNWYPCTEFTIRRLNEYNPRKVYNGMLVSCTVFNGNTFYFICKRK